MAGCTVLGPIRAFDAEGCELTLVSEPQRRLLAILCLHVGSVVRSAALEEHLSLSAGALRTSISRLRRVIGPDVLVGGPAGYELRADVDVVAYEQLVSEAHDADAVSSRAALERARSLWQGTPYDEFAHEPWAKVEVCRLGELHAAAMEELVALLLDAGDDAAAMAILVPLIDEHPYRDPLRGLLMRALWQVGRTTEALREFQTYRALLRDDIGAEPSAALVDLDRAIVAGGDLGMLCEQGHRAWVRRRRPDPVGDPLSRLSLPTPISSFVGRAHETADVAALLQLAEQIVEVADALINDMERAPNLTESLHLARGQIALGTRSPGRGRATARRGRGCNRSADRGRRATWRRRRRVAQGVVRTHRRRCVTPSSLSGNVRITASWRSGRGRTFPRRTTAPSPLGRSSRDSPHRRRSHCSMHRAPRRCPHRPPSRPGTWFRRPRS